MNSDEVKALKSTLNHLLINKKIVNNDINFNEDNGIIDINNFSFDEDTRTFVHTKLEHVKKTSTVRFADLDESFFDDYNTRAVINLEADLKYAIYRLLKPEQAKRKNKENRSFTLESYSNFSMKT